MSRDTTAPAGFGRHAVVAPTPAILGERPHALCLAQPAITGTIQALKGRSSFCCAILVRVGLPYGTVLFVCGSPSGSTTPTAIACGSADKYCPSGSGSPLSVAVGSYSMPENVSTVLRTGVAVCPAGSYCQSGQRLSCVRRSLRVGVSRSILGKACLFYSPDVVGTLLMLAVSPLSSAGRSIRLVDKFQRFGVYRSTNCFAGIMLYCCAFALCDS